MTSDVDLLMVIPGVVIGSFTWSVTDLLVDTESDLVTAGVMTLPDTGDVCVLEVTMSLGGHGVTLSKTDVLFTVCVLEVTMSFAVAANNVPLYSTAVIIGVLVI